MSSRDTVSRRRTGDPPRRAGSSRRTRSVDDGRPFTPLIGAVVGIVGFALTIGAGAGVFFGVRGTRRAAGDGLLSALEEPEERRTVRLSGRGDRDDKQVHLVDEVVIEQPPGQDAAAVQLQLTCRLGFQLTEPPRRHRRGRSCSPSAVR